jgi:SAM-dependent methyltransferase
MSAWQLIEQQLQCEVDPAFQERARLLLRRIYERRPRRVLDLGCGRGFYVKMILQFDFVEQLVAIDSQADHLCVCLGHSGHDPRLQVLQADASNLPIQDSSFDFILCSEVLEHLKDDRKCAEELSRTLFSSGCVGISVPHLHFPFLWDPVNWVLMACFNTHVPKDIHWLAGIWADHERLYDRKRLIALLSESLKVQTVVGVVRWCFPFTHFLLYGIGKNLVLRGGFSSCNRFSNASQNFLSRWLASLVGLPSNLFDRYSSKKVAMTLVLFAKK